MIFNIQILSTYQDSRVIDLLSFPSFPLLPNEIDIDFEFKMWTRGKNQCRKEKDRSQIIQFLTQESFNSIELNYQFLPYRVKNTTITIHKITQYLNISPTNELWSDVTSYKFKNNYDESIRQTHESKEISLRHNQINNYPTILETKIEFSSNYRVLSALYSKLNKLLSLSFASNFLDLLDISIIGCSELYDNNFVGPTNNILDQLAPWPKACSHLGEFFDAIHPIMIGKLNLCININSALDRKGNLKVISSNLASLYIPDTIIQSEKIKKVQPFLVKKNELNSPTDLDPKKGEFKILPSEINIYTARRMKELCENNLFPNLQYLKPVHVILPHYCQMIGINPDDMVVCFLDNYTKDKLTKKIDMFLMQYKKNVSLHQKVFEVHKKAWEEICKYEVIEFVKGKYFSELSDDL